MKRSPLAEIVSTQMHPYGYSHHDQVLFTAVILFETSMCRQARDAGSVRPEFSADIPGLTPRQLLALQVHDFLPSLAEKLRQPGASDVMCHNTFWAKYRPDAPSAAEAVKYDSWGYVDTVLSLIPEARRQHGDT